jgi:non-ribosomal peptide synthetase component E (peptide arylation enzyme)
MSMDDQRIVGLVATSSPDFVTRIFQSWQAGLGVVTLRTSEDRERLSLTGAAEVVVPDAGSGWLEQYHEPRSDGSIAQIAFTSGTEGEPKGVILSHANLADVVARLNSVMTVTSEIREYVGVPVYHSFGFGRCRAVCAAGGRAFLPARGFNPVEINGMLEAGEINAVSAVPSLWRVLLATGGLTPRAARRVRWIEIGSQSMSRAEKSALRELFPEAVIVQHYGLTEASRSTFLKIHEASPEQLDSVGHAYGKVEIALSPDGCIMIRGPHVSSRLLSGGKLVDPRDADGWLVTKDRGALAGQELSFLGRADDVINCGGLKLSPDVLEAHVRESLGLGADFSVCRVPNAIRGDGILIAVTRGVSTSDEELTRAVLAAAAAYNVNARDATHVLRVDSLPRTDTGKVKRDELGKRFALIAPATPPLPPSGRAEAGTLRGELGAILGVRSVAGHDTFVNLGGDSLRFIQASVVLERKLGYLPDGWEKLTFGELEALPVKLTGKSQVEPSVILRTLAITSVVLNHTGALDSYFPIDGAAFLLLVPAGYSFARFQLQRVLESGRAAHALGTLPRVIVPTVLVLVAQQARHHELHLSQLFLYNNFVSPPGGFNYWFIEVYVQVHLLLALLLSVRALHAPLGKHPYTSSVALVLVAALASVAIPLVWNTDHLGNLLPHFALWYFLLGWCALFGEQRWQRWLNSALIVGLSLALLPGTSRGVWIIAGGLFLNWMKPVRLPVPLARGISTLASASLYIYISHWLVLEPFARVFPGLGFVGQVVFAWLVGVGFWFCFERAWQALRRVLDQRSLRVRPA